MTRLESIVNLLFFYYSSTRIRVKMRIGFKVPMNGRVFIMIDPLNKFALSPRNSSLSRHRSTALSYSALCTFFSFSAKTIINIRLLTHDCPLT